MAEKNKTKTLYDKVMDRFRNDNGPNSDPNEAENKALSYARGAGGNFGFGDAIADWNLKRTQDPNNTYAGRSAGETLSENSDEATRKYPTANRIGGEQVAGSLATLANMAVPGLGGSLALPGRALLSAIPGAAHGAYTARRGEDRTEAAAIGAGTSALFPLAEAAASKLGLGRSLANMLRPGATEEVAEQAVKRSAAPEVAAKPARPKSLWERTPTIPPDAAPTEAGIKQIAERNRTPSLPPEYEVPFEHGPRSTMIPPPDDSALESMVSTRGIPEAKLPIEWRGPNRPGVAPDNELFPTGAREQDVQANLDWYRDRGRDQRMAENFAPDFKLPVSQPQYGPQSRGRDIFRLQQGEPQLTQDLGTMPAEYQRPGVQPHTPTEYDLSGARGRAAMNDTAATAPPGSGGASPSGEFNLGGPPSAPPGAPVLPELQSIPPAPNANTVALPPGGNAPMPTELQRLREMGAPAKAPRGADDFVKAQETGTKKTAKPGKPKRKKPDEDDKDE